MDVVGTAILVVQIVGFVGGGIVIYHLKQAIDAQAKAFKTVNELAKTAIDMAKAADPKKYAEQVQVYQELVQKNADLLVADARREAQTKATKALEAMMQHYEWAVRIGLAAIPYIPKSQRRAALDTVSVPDGVKKPYRDLAKTAPDWSISPLGRLAFGDELPGLATISDAAAWAATEQPSPRTHDGPEDA